MNRYNCSSFSNKSTSWKIIKVDLWYTTNCVPRRTYYNPTNDTSSCRNISVSFLSRETNIYNGAVTNLNHKPSFVKIFFKFDSQAANRKFATTETSNVATSKRRAKKTSSVYFRRMKRTSTEKGDSHHGILCNRRWKGRETKEKRMAVIRLL